MPFSITDACIGCGDCTVICPQAAIAATDWRAGAVNSLPGPGWRWTPFFAINGRCDGCGRCGEVCPAQAVQPGGGEQELGG